MIVSEHNVASLWRSAVACVGVAKSHGGNERATQAVEHVSHKDPIDREYIRVGRDDDSDDLAHHHTQRTYTDQPCPAVSIRERSQLWTGERGQDARDELAV